MTKPKANLPTKTDWIAAVTGDDVDGLAHGIWRQHQDKGGDTLVDVAVAAHNSGEVDLLALIRCQGKLGHFGRSLFAKAIPRLAITLPDLLQTLEVFDGMAGDMQLQSLRDGMIERWCLGQADHPGIAIDALEDGTLSSDYLGRVLQSALAVDTGRYLPRLLGMLADADAPRRDAAAHTVGNSTKIAEPDLAKVVRALEKAIGSGSFSPALVAAIVSIGLRNPSLNGPALKAIGQARQQADPALRTEVGRALLFNVGTSDPVLVEAALDLACDITSENFDTINMLDSVIYEGLGGTRSPVVLAAMERLLDVPGITVSNFDSSAHKLLTDDPLIRDAALVRWLSDGRDALIKAAHDLITAVPGDDLRLALNFAKAKLDQEKAIGLARKLCSAMAVYPKTLASILASLMSTGPKSAAPAIQQLLFDPVLTNYWEGPRTRLEEIEKTATSSDAALIRGVLDRHDAYKAGIMQAGTIVEFAPSERRRYLIAVKQAQESRAIAKAAERDSILGLIATKSLMLYGDASIFTVYVEPGKTAREESQLRSSEFYHELPRLHIIDPLGEWYRREMFSRGRDIE